MDRTTYDVKQIIVKGLDWCTKNKKYRDDTEGGKSSRAVKYNQAWLQLIRRILDYTQDKDNLIKVYEGLKRTQYFDPELKRIICNMLIKEGKKRELVYFTDTQTIKEWLKIN